LNKKSIKGEFMKTKTKLLKLKATSIFALVAIAVFTVLSVGSAHAQEVATATAAVFGSIGVGARQSVRVNVVNARPTDSIFPADSATPVRVEIRILDRAGNVLARDRTRITPGQTVELQYSPVFIPGIPNRTQVSAIVIINHPRERYGSKFIASTLEIVNNDNGISSAFAHPASLVGFNPQPEPPAAF
jgi:hypothetical protein